MNTPSSSNALHLLDHLPAGLIVLDSEGNISWCNTTLASWLGREVSDFIGLSEAALLHTGNPADAILGNGRYQVESAKWLLRKQIYLPDGEQAVSYLDISEEENLRRDRSVLTQQLEHFDTIEPISGLLNSQAISKGLDPLVSRSRRYQNQLSLVTMEITSLAQIVSNNGQAIADKTIHTISQLLRDQMRWADLLGHLDNGQFVFVLPETDLNAAKALAHKIGTQINRFQVDIGDHETLQAEACFGIASWTKGDDANSLLRRSADAAQLACQNGAFSIEAA